MSKLDLQNVTFKIGVIIVRIYKFLEKADNPSMLNPAINLIPDTLFDPKQNHPYTFLKYDDVADEWHSAGGIEFRMIDTLRDHYNFSYHLINCNQTIGSPIEPDSEQWSGMIGLLMNGSIDLGLSGITYDYDISTVVPFFYPHLTTVVTFATHTPKIHSDWNQLIKPFQPLVWLAFFFVLSLCTFYHILYQRLKVEKNFNVIWFAINSLLRQPYKFRWHPDISLKHYLIVWSFGSLILTTVYAGCLCSIITVPMLKTLDTVDDLIEAAVSERINVYTEGNSTYTQWIKESKGKFKRLSQVLRTVPDPQTGFTMIRKSRYTAFISDRHGLQYGRLLYGVDEIYIPPLQDRSTLFTVSIGIPMRPAFPYRDQFQRSISWMRSSGLLQYWKNEEFRIASEFHQIINIGDGKPYTLKQLQYYFLFWIMNLTISSLFFILELGYFHFKFKN